MILLAVLLTVPVLKLSWTLGGGDAANDALGAMGVPDWLNIVAGIFLTNALLATVLAVVACRVIYSFFAAAGGAAWQQRFAQPTTMAWAAVVPIGAGVVVGAFNGLVWAVITMAVGYVLRLGVIGDYATGRRSADTGRRTGQAVETAAQRASFVIWIVSLVLAVVVLPVLAVAAALDGRAWSTVLICDVDTGGGPHRARVAVLTWSGSGVVAWDIAARAVVNGRDCATDPDDRIRDPWWRS
ncbi:hypothetical protein EBN03_10005 [Nocardia stercoris]|uniref:Uncharacterized protein n=1 Tax=Nocardia stercoris TaxID=2483361 RepID=A0A3M2L742_9NOCA|nr:hypothetical protein EBN03_10005 [Nocardia stercoris]